MSVTFDDGTPTTRRYSRTLADAFPDERANAVEVYRRPSHALIGQVVGFIAAIGAATLIAIRVIDALGLR